VRQLEHKMIGKALKSLREEEALTHARIAHDIAPDAFQTGYELAATLIVLHRSQEADQAIRSLPRDEAGP
jgi:hypothetical protein